MERWRHVVMYEDRIIIWRGMAEQGRVYRLTPNRRRRFEELLGDAVTPADDDQSQLWSWNDWDWAGIAGGRR